MAELVNVEAERGFLTALVLLSESDPARARQALETSLVVPERMGTAATRDTLAAVASLLADGQSITAQMLGAKLNGSQPVAEAGGPAWLADLAGGVGYEHQIPAFAEAIREMALRRKQVAIARDLLGRAQDLTQPAADTLLDATRALSSITLSKRELRTVEDYLMDCVNEMQDIADGKAEPVIPTGLPSLDALIGGLQPTLIVIGAMPGVGKSALLATLSNNIAGSGRKIGVFSLEDEGRWLAWRLLSHAAGVPQFILRNRRLNSHQMDRVGGAYSTLGVYARNILVDDRSGLTPKEIVQTSRDMILNHGCRAIFVDHAGEMRFEGGGRERHDLELADGLSDLRDIAKRYRVPVVVAAHLRRRQGFDSGDEPVLTDFADASAFERKARIALGLSRKAGSDTLRITLLKQTNGATSFMGKDGFTTNGIDLTFAGMAAMVKDCEGAIGDPYATQGEGQR